MPTVSCNRSSEKSYSPRRFTCCNDTPEPWVKLPCTGGSTDLTGSIGCTDRTDLRPLRAKMSLEIYQHLSLDAEIN
jgi:hypothetical protein